MGKEELQAIKQGMEKQNRKEDLCHFFSANSFTSVWRRARCGQLVILG